MLEDRFNTEATQRVIDSINELLESTVTAYEIQAQTGLQRTLIGRLRKGEIKLENIAFKNALILYAYAEEIKKSLTLLQGKAFSEFIPCIILQRFRIISVLICTC